MKLLVVVPSTDSLKGAGVRIRYNRLAEPLAREGVQVLINTVEQCCEILRHCDVVLISKVMDTRAVGVAHACRRHGVPVGADIFDNYFSQKERPACRPQRRWLQQLSRHLDFALCSTEAMGDVICEEAPGLPLHQLADTHGGRIEMLNLLRRTLQEREARQRRTRQIHVLWFGIGDNPVFDVGLSDLERQSEQLKHLERTGRQVMLRVLTNERALNTQGLQRLNRLPVSTTVEIWNEELETSRLLESDVAFLPVASTDFSRVKSPNRGITALEHGCQVLTTDVNVYKSVEPFIYTEGKHLLEDLETGRMKVRDETISEVRTLLNNVASPTSEARRLTRFLMRIKEQNKRAPRSHLAIMNGIQPSPIRPGWCQQCGVFSVQTALSGPDNGEDVLFQLDSEGEVIVVLSNRLNELAVATETGGALQKVHPSQHTSDRWVYKLKDVAAQIATMGEAIHALAIGTALQCRTTGERLTLCNAVINATQVLLRGMVPGIEIALNEELPVPL